MEGDAAEVFRSRRTRAGLPSAPMVARGTTRGASAARDLARRFGVSIEKYPPPGSLEHNLMQIIKALNINCVIDVGAHCGEYATLLRTTVRYEGRIVSFEPGAHAFEQLNDVMKNDSKLARHRDGARQ